MGRNPVREKTRAGRETATLEDVVKHQQHAEQYYQRVGCNAKLNAQNRGAEAECEARQYAEQQADRHMVTTIHTVCQQSVQEA